MNEEEELPLHPAPPNTRSNHITPYARGSWPVRTVHPVHTGSSVNFVRFDKEGRGWV